MSKFLFRSIPRCVTWELSEPQKSWQPFRVCFRTIRSPSDKRQKRSIRLKGTAAFIDVPNQFPPRPHTWVPRVVTPCNSHSTPRAYTCRSTCKSIYDTVWPRIAFLSATRWTIDATAPDKKVQCKRAVYTWRGARNETNALSSVCYRNFWTDSARVNHWNIFRHFKSYAVSTLSLVNHQNRAVC